MVASIRKILVVDDEISLVQLCQIILESAGYHVRTAIDGREALDIVTEEKPDLVLLDVMMPGMSGIEVCRHIRKHFQSDDPRIVMYTADDSGETLNSSMDAGADDLISKDTPVFDLPAKIGDYLH